MSDSLNRYNVYDQGGKLVLRGVKAESPYQAMHHNKLIGPSYEVVAIGRGATNPWAESWNHPHFTDNPPTWHFGIRKIGSIRNPTPYMVKLRPL